MLEDQLLYDLIKTQEDLLLLSKNKKVPEIKISK